MHRDDVGNKRSLPDFLRSAKNLKSIVQVKNNDDGSRAFQLLNKDDALSTYYSETVEPVADDFGYDRKLQ